jgi:anthranilate synthase component 1
MPPRTPVMQELPLVPDATDRMLALHGQSPDFYPAFLDSAAPGGELGRFSLLLAAPGQRLQLDRRGRITGPGAGHGFCARLNAWWREEVGPAPPPPWPFAGGWLLYLGYELAAEVEPSLHIPESPLEVVASAVRVTAAILHDHATARSLVMGEAGAERHVERLITEFTDCRTLPEDGPYAGHAGVVEDDPALYLEACRSALAHIAAGDVYQANLARSWRIPMPPGASIPGLYRRLRKANPGAFAGLAQLPGFHLLSSSPERLVRVRGRKVDTRPIAGTRPRLGDRDASAIAELTGSAKERAEHVMLIDLERNDLGRLCEAGTVQVDEFMVVESYAHVHHIVSNVSGQLRADVEPGDVIRALFPGGTITGCPKVRCMQLIGDLEAKGRGAYTGALGYLALDGSLDLNILIRTMTVREGIIEFRAGAGIVADSEPARELDETRAKARGLLRALGGEG